MAAPPDRTRYDVPYGSPYDPDAPQPEPTPHETPSSQETRYERPGTVYGRSATVYGRTVTDPGGDAAETGFLGFEGVREPTVGRHSASRDNRLAGTLAAAGLPAVALGLAVLALLIAGIATVTGIVAVGHATTAEIAAREAAGLASSAAAAVEPTADRLGLPGAVEPSPGPATPAPPSPSPTPDPDRLDPGADFELAYSGQFVRVQAATCEGTGVDLDEPRVLPPAGADAAYRSCADGFHLDFGDASGFAVVADAEAPAVGCANAIRADPGLGWVAPAPGTTVCVLTSRLAAEPRGLPAKLVRLQVRNVEADGTLVAGLTAWVVP